MTWLRIFRSPTVVAVFLLELAERTAYYGTVFSITRFATLMLRLSTGTAFVLTNIVFALAPLSAFVGGIFADTWFDRPSMLIASAFVYLLGIAFLTISASESFFGNALVSVPTVAPFMIFVPGLILLSLSYGVFKTCTAPLLAEGVLKLLKDEEDKEAEVEDNKEVEELSQSKQGGDGATPDRDSLLPSDAATTAAVDNSSGREGDTMNKHQQKNNTKTSDVGNTPPSADDHLIRAASSNPPREEEEEAESSDVLRRKEAEKEKIMADAFSIYSAVINIGSLIGFSVVPSLRHEGRSLMMRSYADGKPIAAGFVNSWAMCLGLSCCALIVFVAIRRMAAASFVGPKVSRQSILPQSPSSASSPSSFHRLTDPRAYVAHLAASVGLTRCARCIDAEDDMSDSNETHIASLTTVLKLFSFLPLYWFATSQTASTFQVQALCSSIPPDSWLTVEMLNLVNVFAFLISLPFVQWWMNWLIERQKLSSHHGGSEHNDTGSGNSSRVCCGMFRSVLTFRLTCGFLVSVVTMVVAGIIQIHISSVAVQDADGVCTLIDPRARREDVLPSAFAITLPFLLSGVASALVDPAALEAAFDLAAPDMKSTVMSLYLLASSVSGFIGLAAAPAFAEPSAFVGCFFGLAAALVLVGGFWVWVVRDFRTRLSF